MSELLPCPFCGGEAEILTAESMHGGYLFGIMCNDCRSRGDVYDTEAKAIEAWNTRTPEQAIAATLGGGECENANKDGYGFRFECSKCGYSSITTNCRTRNDELPKFCPNCGRKVKR